MGLPVLNDGLESQLGGAKLPGDNYGPTDIYHFKGPNPAENALFRAAEALNKAKFYQDMYEKPHAYANRDAYRSLTQNNLERWAQETSKYFAMQGTFVAPQHILMYMMKDNPEGFQDAVEDANRLGTERYEGSGLTREYKGNILTKILEGSPEIGPKKLLNAKSLMGGQPGKKYL
ncbi:hypothetical protein K9M79_06655 [Candidatus Woesearchaeota archaeon]|nr:hypothetical protein [Candidatus Woesearchaeota archaeon]